MSSSSYRVEDRLLVERPTAVSGGRLREAEIPGWLGAAYEMVFSVMRAQGLQPAGPPFARYRKVDAAPGEETFDVEAGFPLPRPMPSGDAGGHVRPSSLPAGPAAATVHVGPYEAMRPAYQALEAWISEHGGEPDGVPWESYLSEAEGDPASWRTEVVQPYRRGPL